MKSRSYASKVDVQIHFIYFFFSKKKTIAHVVETKESMMSEEIRTLDAHLFS